ALASGSVHANWFAAGCALYEDDQPVMNPAGQPRTATFLLPPSAVTIHDTWDSLGLRGTSSHDFTVQDAVVPEDWQFNHRGTRGRLPDPLYAYDVVHAGMPAVS